jgi:hypothetical protein
VNIKTINLFDSLVFLNLKEESTEAISFMAIRNLNFLFLFL